MDKKQFQEIKQKPVSELQKQLKDLRDKLWQLKVDLAAGKVKNVREVRFVKKDIARIITTINSNKHGKA